MITKEVALIQTLRRNWWLLVLCGVLEAIISIVNFSHAGHGVARKGTIVLMGRLMLAAGVCTIVAGIWRSAKRKRCLFVVLNGLALGALGLILNGAFGFRISFRTIAFLIILMAMSIGIFEFMAARNAWVQHHVADVWFLGLAGAASVGFVFAFFALGFGWIKLDPLSPGQTLIWVGSYFAFSAICMLVLAVRLGSSQSGDWEGLPYLGNPKHAH